MEQLQMLGEQSHASDSAGAYLLPTQLLRWTELRPRRRPQQ